MAGCPGLILLALVALRDVFFIAVLTSSLSYIGRSIVQRTARRLGPADGRPTLDRWLTLAVFAVPLPLPVAVISDLGTPIRPRAPTTDVLRHSERGRWLITRHKPLNPY